VFFDVKHPMKVAPDLHPPHQISRTDVELEHKAQPPNRTDSEDGPTPRRGTTPKVG